MEGKCNSRAKQSWLSGVESSEKEEMGKEESETEVAVDCCSVALKTGHQGEDREREGETDARKRRTENGEERQCRGERGGGGQHPVDVHQHRKVGQMVTGAPAKRRNL